ncbi:MAG TPA: response regulator [Nitrososphaeraceae archaeon]|nr:response regulator [Nitrososphaeraceae archaeon]
MLFLKVYRNAYSKKQKHFDKDDDEDLTNLYETFLKFDGYKVDAFTDAVDALSSFRKDVYDLALIDLKMPKMNGIELLQKFQNIDPDLLFRFITAANKEYIENLKVDNPYVEENVIYKPLWLNEIRTTIHSLLVKSQQQKEDKNKLFMIMM